MKAKRFAITFALSLTFLSAVSEIRAMPKASDLLAFYYTLFENQLESFVNEIEYRAGIEEAEKAAEDFKHRQRFSQEQAEKEVRRMTESGDLPNYILSKGVYKYDGNINTVYCISDTNLLSQPDKDSRVILDLHTGYFSPNVALNGCSYLGEWTSPQGERWVIVNFEHQEENYDEDDDEEVAESANQQEKKILTGFFYGKDVSFVTDAQIREVVKAIEIIKIVMSDAAFEKKAMEERFNEELQKVRQQAQRQIQQAQRQAQQSQQHNSSSKEQHYYCRRCGEQRIVSSPVQLPSGKNACLPRGAKRAGAHDWTRLD